ncbi:hypothetical protein [endosymbiont GvMRE of Glomus versiforme]|uniref:hypothetical protein n=1 Tax=endosymbiont GvMRE of Glomus versiforme TaxID=2039283 RepID=UPI000EE4BC8D|nr:hypothetical protein [endosymbiont GvMRE of Glomus versiforme]RHZ36464.1 hypothetical protein GvMRE_I2g467 [endosymbiont GvMRE of Glomus versiforme]
MNKIWQVKNQNDLTLQLIKGLGYPTRTNEKGEIFIWIEKEKKEYKIGQVGKPARKKKKLDDDEIIDVVV